MSLYCFGCRRVVDADDMTHEFTHTDTLAESGAPPVSPPPLTRSDRDDMEPPE